MKIQKKKKKTFTILKFQRGRLTVWLYYKGTLREKGNCLYFHFLQVENVRNTTFQDLLFIKRKKKGFFLEWGKKECCARGHRSVRNKANVLETTAH